MSDCPHTKTTFRDDGMRVCAVCGAASDNQRSPLQMVQEIAAKSGDTLVGQLFQTVADRLAEDKSEPKPPKSGDR